MKCPRCGYLVLETDEACVRCGVQYVDKPPRPNPLPAKIAVVLALIGAAAGQQVFKETHPISRVGGEYDWTSWAGGGGLLLGTAGYLLGAVAFGRKKYD